MLGGQLAGEPGPGSRDGYDREGWVENRGQGRGCSTGCFLLVAAAVLVVFLGPSLLSQFWHPFGEPAHEMRTDGRSVSRDVTLTPETPSAALTVVVTYPGSMPNGAAGSLSVSAPRFAPFPAAASPAPEASATIIWAPPVASLPSLTPAPVASSAAGSPALDPLTDPDVVVEITPTNYSPKCHAPCELLLRSNACDPSAGSCSQTFAVTLSLADPAGRGMVVVRVRAGLTVQDASVPGGFKIEIRDGAATTRHDAKGIE